MKRTILFLLASCSLFLVEAQSSKSLTQYVEPRIGTAHCRAFHFAPGSMPFGMAKPGPSTNGSLGNADGWQATGYDYRDTSIEGFVCTHEFQVGGISVMPTTGLLLTTPGLPDGTGPRGYRSAYSHDDEYATAGYYQVMLNDYDINAEVTATQRVAFLRFTYPETQMAHLIFDIGHQQGESGKVKDAEVWVNEDGTAEGWVITRPEYIKKYQPNADQRIYFSAEVDTKPVCVGVFNGDEVRDDQTYTHGIGAGAYMNFHTKDSQQITVKVGISYTSVQNARINLKAEATGVSFDEARNASQKAWEEALRRIQVEGKNEEDFVKFYTGLYHALLGRGVMSDVNGAYPKHDGTIGQVPMKGGQPLFQMFNTDAMWGGQWNLTQLWALAYPEHLSEFISSTLQEYKDCGWLADGLANSKYVSGVGTNQLPLMIDAAYQCGIRDFDLDLAYEACLKNEMDGKNRPEGAGKDDTADFVELGYAPHKN
ncbi:MAG: glycoside hydrolase family 92 protein, partial [Bacteroidaceae bacterium]|nr:glycoside hydrolase family 92 protein [Bacteroidaceae bacterium]